MTLFFCIIHPVRAYGSSSSRSCCFASQCLKLFASLYVPIKCNFCSCPWWFKDSSKIRICSNCFKIFFKWSQLLMAHTCGFSRLETQTSLFSTYDFFSFFFSEESNAWVSQGSPSCRGSYVPWVTVKSMFFLSQAFVLRADTQWNKALDSPQRSFREGWHQAPSLPKADLNCSVIYVLGSLLISDLMAQK